MLNISFNTQSIIMKCMLTSITQTKSSVIYCGVCVKPNIKSSYPFVSVFTGVITESNKWYTYVIAKTAVTNNDFC